MRFGHVFQERLKTERFPPEWIESAISYKQLKKCIGRLTRELSQVGLDPETLGKLLKHVENYNASATAEVDQDRPFEYILEDEDAPDEDDVRGNGPKTRKRQFHPKLLFYVIEETGELHSARLDENTKSKLQTLAVATGLSDLRVTEENDAGTPSLRRAGSIASSLSVDSSGTVQAVKRNGYRIVEVPLTSDAEFFSMLSTELSGLEALQEQEAQKLHSQIEDLGKQIASLTDPGHRSNKKNLAVWRQIFQAYVEAGIFFGVTERDHSAHDAAKAQEKFRGFADMIVKQGLATQFKKQDCLKAVSAFMQINQELLQVLRFQEINQIAMSKILKKFDKRTALGVKSTLPQRLQFPAFSKNLAKAICSEMQNEILGHVPQLDDYSCPMCFEVEWRPVRLRCGHVFCIRCLIVMQQNKQGRCPLCREKTVADANSDNLDLELAEFLKKWFPDEVKAKQKYNELMAGVDQYGEVYKDKCVVM